MNIGSRKMTDGDWRLNRPRKASHGVTLVELLALLTILTVLVMLLFPAVGNAVRASKQTACLGNLRNVGTAILSYAVDHNGLPHSTATVGRWKTWLVPEYLPRMPFCPLATKKDKEASLGMRYAGNVALCMYFPSLRNIPAPTNRIFLATEFYHDNDGFWSWTQLNTTMWGFNNPGREEDKGENPRPQYHGTSARRGLNVFFLDGHCELVFPPNNDWANARGNAVNGLYFFSQIDLGYIKQGKYGDFH